MRTVTIADMTLRTSPESDVMLSFKEKVEIAKHLNNLCVDVIELPALYDLQADTLLLRTISAFADNSILSLSVGNTVESVKNSWEALNRARHPRLLVSLPVSPVQMEYLCHKKPAAMLASISELCTAAANCCDDVEFMAGDATRADRTFLVNAINAAIEAGVKTVTICDSAATLLPDAFAAFITELKKEIPALSKVRIGAVCKNDYDFAVSSAIFAIRAGVDEIKVLSGGKSYPSIVPLAQLISAQGEALDISCGIRMTDLIRQTDQIKWINKSKRKDTTPFDSTVGSKNFDGIYLGKDESIEAVSAVIKKLGYDLSEEDTVNVYERFLNIGKKKADSISAKELEMIISSVALQVPAAYQLKSYVVNSGNIITATAHITLEKDKELLEGVSLGDGPIDASFLAIEQIIGHHYELDDFQIQSVTEGHSAMGSALVRLRSNGKIYSGNGISTDIIGASVRAYVSALNKIVYEEADR